MLLWGDAFINVIRKTNRHNASTRKLNSLCVFTLSICVSSCACCVFTLCVLRVHASCVAFSRFVCWVFTFRVLRFHASCVEFSRFVVKAFRRKRPTHIEIRKHKIQIERQKPILEIQKQFKTKQNKSKLSIFNIKQKTTFKTNKKGSDYGKQSLFPLQRASIIKYERRICACMRACITTRTSKWLM